MEFTQDELYEIEKIFDTIILQTTERMISVAEKTTHEELRKKLLDSAFKTYEAYRIISAKAGCIRTINGTN